jgi:hypothetical protein
MVFMNLYISCQRPCARAFFVTSCFRQKVEDRSFSMFGDHTLSRVGESGSQDRLLLLGQIIPSVEVSDVWSYCESWMKSIVQCEMVVLRWRSDGRIKSYSKPTLADSGKQFHSSICKTLQGAVGRMFRAETLSSSEIPFLLLIQTFNSY